MSEKLLPCPFCGEVYVVHDEGHVKVTETARSGPRFGVNCYRCGGRIQFFKFKEQAIEAWNTRAERTCKDTTSEEHTQAFTCSECGCWVAYDEYWETGIYVQGEGQAVHIHPHYCPNCGAKVVKK